MLDISAIRHLLETELATDRVADDVTSCLLGATAAAPARAVVFAKEPGVFCGQAVVKAFALPGLTLECLWEDSKAFEVQQPLVQLHGAAAVLLGAERTLLNTLSHLCGIATQTQRFVAAVGDHPTRILATRKTLPGLRDLQLYAVRCGGGHVHRRSLSDGVLIKDNHLALAGGANLVERAKSVRSPLHGVEVEVQSLEQLRQVLEWKPTLIMLDNFDLERTREALALIAGHCPVEVSGGMTLDRVAALAALGVDYLSVGALTHSVRALDLSMDIEWGGH